MSFDDEPELVDVEAFDRRFTNLLPGLADDLVTLEKDGALYANFWTEDIHGFASYRVRLLPLEVVQYVDGAVGHQEFRQAMTGGASFDEALEAVSDRRVRELVRSYTAQIERDGELIDVDIRGCFASFIPRELESLTCGHRLDRYERLPDLGDGRSQMAIVRLVCSTFHITAAHLGGRGRDRPPIVVENEYDVQDLLWASLRPLFPDARYEDPTPKLAGKSRRIDLVLPSLRLVLEVKMVRDKNHASKVVEELMVDIESYHAHPECGNLLAFVYDPRSFIDDPQAMIDGLKGLRVKGEHRFEVEVIVAR